MGNCGLCDFKKSVVRLGPWFDGMAKFIDIMIRHNDEIYTGERLMLEKLRRETFKLDKFVKVLIAQVKSEGEELAINIVRTVQERMLAEGTVGYALSMTPHDFFEHLVADDERQAIDGILTQSKFMDQCLYEPLKVLLGLSGCPNLAYSLDDESIPARLFVAAVNDGVVSIIVGESETPVVMEGATAKMMDSFSIAELMDSDLDCAVVIGGYHIEFRSGTTAN